MKKINLEKPAEYFPTSVHVHNYYLQVLIRDLQECKCNILNLNKEKYPELIKDYTDKLVDACSSCAVINISEIASKCIYDEICRVSGEKPNYEKNLAFFKKLYKVIDSIKNKFDINVMEVQNDD